MADDSSRDCLAAVKIDVSSWTSRQIHGLFHGAMDAMAIVDDAGQILAANTALGQLLAIAPQTLMGQSLPQLASWDLPTLLHQANAQNFLQGELCWRDRSNRQRYIRYTLTPHFQAHQHLWVCREIPGISAHSMDFDCCAAVDLDRNCSMPGGSVPAEPQHPLPAQHSTQPLSAHSCTMLPRDPEQAIAAIYGFQVFVNRDWHYTYFSPACEAVFGYTPDALLREPTLLLSRIPAQERQDLLQSAFPAIFAEQTYSCQFSFQHSDGHWRSLSATIISQKDVTQDCWNVTVVAVNISNYKHLETALQVSEHLYKTLFEIFPIGISITDEAGNIIAANSASEKILGIPTNQQTQLASHASQWQIMRPNGSPMPIEEYTSVRALKEQRVIQNEEMGVLRPDGSMAWLSVTAAPIPLPGYGVAIAYLDISEHKQTATMLHLQNTALHACANGVVITDHHGSIQWANPAFTRLTGYCVEEVLGKNPRQLVKSGLHHPDFYRLLWKTILAGQVWRGEIINRRKDGTTYTEEMTIAPVHNPQGTISHFIAIKQDVSDRKQAERELKNRHQELLTLHRISEIALNAPSLQVAFQEIVEEVGANTGFPIVAIELYDAIRQMMRFVGVKGIPLMSVDEVLEVPVDQTLSGTVAKTKQAVVKIYQPNEAKTCDSNATLSQLGIKTFVCIPMAVNHRILGTLSLGHPDVVNIPDHFLTWMTSLAGYISALVERKQIESALWESQKRYQDLIHSIHGVVWEFDWRSQRFTFVSQKAESMFGYPLERWLTEAGFWESCIHPDDRDWAINLCFTSTQAQEDHLFEYRFITADQRVLWLQDIVAVVVEAGQPVKLRGVMIDISDRKQSEIRLREREQEFRALVEHAPDCILRVDRHFRYLYVNPKIEELSGIAANEYLGKTNPELGMPDFLCDLWQSAMERTLTTGQEQTLEYDYPCTLGILRTFHSRVVPEFAEDKSVQSLLVIARDITPLKQAQKILQRQAQEEHLIRLITQHIRETLDLDRILSTTVAEVRQFLQTDRTLIYRINPDRSGTVVAESVVAPYMSLLGQKITDPCLAKPACLFRYANGHSQMIENIETADLAPCYVELLQHIQVQATLVLPILQSHSIWGLLIAQHCASPRIWHPEEITLLQQLSDQVAIAIQQSELYQQVQHLNTNLEHQVRERTAELEQSLAFEALLKRITDKVRDSLDEQQILSAVVQELGQDLDLECCDTGIYNADRTLSTITHEYTRSLHSTQGKTFAISDSTHPEIYLDLFQGNPCHFCDIAPNTLRSNQKLLTILACPMMDNQEPLGDIWLFKKPNQYFNEVEIRLIQQVANQCAIALRQSRLYQASQAQVTELGKLNRLKDDFLSTVSHELRTPMSSITMAIQMLEIKLRQINILPPEFLSSESSFPSPEIPRYFQILKDECQREINLINDLLDLTRLEAHAEPLTLTEVNLQHWIPHIVEPFIERSHNQNQNLIVDLSTDPLMIETDLFYLQRVLSELLTNACKYTPAHETITVSAHPISSHIEIGVINSGVEIPPGESDRVFERFYRIPNNDPWKYGGTGLGLALVKKIVTTLGGTITLHSYPGQTVFKLQLPRSLPPSLLN